MNSLKTWRTSLNMTQRQAAEALGLALSTYQSYELGKSWVTGGEKQVNRLLLLACAAVAAGLKEWSDEDVQAH